MSLDEFWYRFRITSRRAQPIMAADFGSEDSTAVVMMQQTENGDVRVTSVATTKPRHVRRSEAAKKWWAEKKAREAAEG